MALRKRGAFLFGPPARACYRCAVVIACEYQSIAADGSVHDLGHLCAFHVVLSGKGRITGTDLPLHVVFSAHVFTKRAQHGIAPHILDHNGTGRMFDPDRYDMSKRLPNIIRAKVASDALVYVSRSYGGADNLITVQDDSGRSWAIVFCFIASGEDSVRMEVLSAHPKVIDQARIKRAKLSQFARQCLFHGGRIPKM